jgi:hypothetical protein
MNGWKNYCLRLTISLEISPDLRKVIEEEWPELVYKLPPKA